MAQHPNTFNYLLMSYASAAVWEGDGGGEWSREAEMTSEADSLLERLISVL